MTTSKIERRVLEAQPILFIQKQVLPTAMQPILAECFGRLYGHGVPAGLAIAGHPMTRYVKTGQGLWTIDCIMPLLAPAPGVGIPRDRSRSGARSEELEDGSVLPDQTLAG